MCYVGNGRLFNCPLFKTIRKFGTNATDSDSQEETEVEVPEEIRVSTAEKLADDLMGFCKRQNEDGTIMLLDPHLYGKSKELISVLRH